MQYSHLMFEGLFDIWKSRNYDPYFYFAEIFNKALAVAADRAIEQGIKLQDSGNPHYPALLVPVGFSMENIAMIAGLFKPSYLTFAFSDLSKEFHQRHMDLVIENIKKINPIMNVREVRVQSDDQRSMEQKIVEWVEETMAENGLSTGQMAIDLTGGTKPMSIGAHNAALSYQNLDAYYLSVLHDRSTQWPIPGTETLIRMKKNNVQVQENMIFVIMPFKDEFSNVYDQGIKKAIEGLQKRCVRMDEEIFSGVIINKIRDNLLKANVIIADLTEQNPNVYYELGLAHAYGKKVIMLTQDIDKAPFDLRHLRMVVYEKDKLDELKVKLTEELQILSNSL